MAVAVARAGCGLVYGGGNIGLMGLVADAVLAEGREVIGVIPEALAKKEIAHHGVSDLRVVGSMHERKALMADLSDGFIALPGGYGTLDEFCEILTWAQLGFHQKPCGLLNVAGFYDSFLAQIDNATRHKFIRPEHRHLILVDTDPESLLRQMSEFHPARIHKWIGRDNL